MPFPYVVRFVSTGSGAGKTRVARRVLELLKLRGYLVGVVKHCSHDIVLEKKDSGEYLEGGADVVVVSSPNLAIIYKADHLDALKSSVQFLKTPIVIVEGYKGEILGDAVLIVRNQVELEELYSHVSSAIAVISHVDLSRIPSELKFFKFGNESELAQLIEKRALDFFFEQLPRTNCQMCSRFSCYELLLAFLRGEADWCPAVSGVKLIVNGMEVPLNTFVKNLIRSTVKGMLQSLRGVPSDQREIMLIIS
ncbi:MAG: molybdopterin-guanine dinucleotide biosynthesis protein MobB [Desulfurococcaceae archaeon]